jgi:hypothetical protein
MKPVPQQARIVVRRHHHPDGSKEENTSQDPILIVSKTSQVTFSIRKQELWRREGETEMECNVKTIVTYFLLRTSGDITIILRLAISFLENLKETKEKELVEFGQFWLQYL